MIRPLLLSSVLVVPVHAQQAEDDIVACVGLYYMAATMNMMCSFTEQVPEPACLETHLALSETDPDLFFEQTIQIENWADAYADARNFSFPGDADDLCEPGDAEIADGTAVGRLLTGQ